MFEALGERLQKVFRTLRGHGHLTETEVREGVREIRMALLEADVHLDVVREFAETVQARAMSEEILGSLTPGQQVVKVVRDALVGVLAADGDAALRRAPAPPSIYLLVGLQGSGKTTTSAKLARWLKTQGRSPLLVAADVRRPAAVEQLKVLGAQIQVPVQSGDPGEAARAVCEAALREARLTGRDPVLVDTAGRLHIDDALMEELGALKGLLAPAEILYVADAMTGQDAVRSAATFHGRLGLTGAILSKADGDARGGAALSLRKVTGVPIRFLGVGEHLEDLEPFNAERMAARILGMGDVLGLIEKAEAAAATEDAGTLARRLRKDGITLDDLAGQIETIGRMGSLRQVLEMLPGGAAMRDMPVDEKGMRRTQAIIRSMTPDERRRPEVIDGGRRLRIARGSGTSVADVNALLRQFKQMKKMMKTLARGGPMARMAGRLGGGRPFRR